MEYTVMVWGWFPENGYDCGGSPEHDRDIDVDADSEEEAIEKACALFDGEYGFEVVKGEIKGQYRINL